MKYEGINFNEKFAKRLTQDQFVNHNSNRHLWPELPAKKKEERLKEVHKLINLK